jgi:Beta propeller domain
VVKGELKIPGYSAYLHPIADGLLIGVGQDANDQGRRTGAQVSLFDVADLSNPKRLATSPLGTDTAAEYDPKAFLWWPASRDVFLPSVTFEKNFGYPTFGVVVTKVGDRSAPTLTRRGFISHTAKVAPQVTPTTVPAGTAPPSTGPLPAPAIAPPPFIQQQPIIRTLIVSGRVVTVSGSGLMVSDLTSLGEQKWIPFATSGSL